MAWQHRPLVPWFSAAIAAVIVFATMADAGRADPPPWAPAYGFNAKQKEIKKNKLKSAAAPAVVYIVPFGIDKGRCNRESISGVLGGGVAGATLGSKAGTGGEERRAAITGGAILGALVGGVIGRSMDRLDQNCVGQILEHAEDGRAVVWSNPDAAARYQVMPAETYRNEEGRYCREYTTSSVISGKVQEVYGTACRQPDGAWSFGS